MSTHNETIEAEHDVYLALCPCRALLDLLANRWSTLAIGALQDGPRRFGELQRKLEGVNPKVLTHTLRRLEHAGFLDRTIIPAVPLHVEYALTDLGRSAAVTASTRGPAAHHSNSGRRAGQAT